MNVSHLQAPLYIDSQPVDPSSFGLSSTSPEEQLSQAESHWLDQAIHLSPKDQAAFKRQLNRMVGDIRKKISNMRALNLATQDIRLEFNKTIMDFNTSAELFHTNCSSYDQAKVKVESRNMELAAKIRSTSVNFAPFSLRKRLVQASDKANQEEKPQEMSELEKRKIALVRCMQGEDPSLSLCIGPLSKGLNHEEKKELTSAVYNAPSTPVLTAVIEKVNIVSSVNAKMSHGKNKPGVAELPHEVIEDVKEATAGKVGHVIKHQYGNSASYWFELGANMMLGHVPEGSKNPWRDLFISADAHIVIMETLTQFLHRVPAYAVITGSHIVAKGARSLEPHLERIAANMEPTLSGHVEYGEGLSFSESVALSQLSLKLAQVPSQVIQEVHHRMSSAVSRTADAIGLTEENAKKALMLLAEYSPELMEERMWANAYEDIQRLRKK
jgi:hypothetical protein